MAKNREPVKAVAESSEEETDSSSSDEQQSKKAQPTITAVSSKTPLPDSSAEEESESEEEEDSIIAKPTITTNAATKKPLPESSESGEEDSESEETAPVVKPKLTPAKRSVPVPEEKEILKTPDTKKAKKNEPTEKVKTLAATVSESSKKNLFQRIWSAEDEIVILKGLRGYPHEVNNANVGAFLDSIKEDLHSVEVNKVQLYDKIKRLKKKFMNNKAKKTRNFTKPLEKETYDLSLEIWGIWGNSESDSSAANGNSKTVKGNKGKAKGKSVVKANDNADNEAGVEVANGYGEGKDAGYDGGKAKVAAGMRFGSFGSNMEKLLSIGADMFEGEEGVKGSKEWKKLEREEMELVHKHTKVILAKANLVLDNMK